MGVGEKLKDIYYMGEEKWYALWDKVDEHLPVYKIIDPVDSVIPSFALFLIILFLLLLFVGFVLIGGISGAQSTLKLSIVDEEGVGISGAIVTIEGINQEYISNEYGLVEDIILPYSSTVSVTAVKDSEQTTLPITLDEIEKIAEIKIDIGVIHLSSSQTIRFENADGTLATGKLDLIYSCSSGRNDAVSPRSDTIYAGQANVSKADECGTLSVQVNSPVYQSATFALISSTNKFTLQPLAPVEMVGVTVNLKYQNVPITEAVSVYAYRGTNLSSTDSKTSVNGQAVFSLPEGDYTFKVQMEKGYKTKSSPVVSLSKATGAKTTTIEMEKNFIGYINATVKEGSTLLSEVHVVLNEKISSTTITPIIALDSNTSGGVLFEIAKEASYRIIATKDGYCDKAVDANVGANVILSMIKYNSTCGNPMKVRVIDQDGKPIAYAKVALFGENTEDTYKLSYIEKVTDFNGYAIWNPVSNSKTGETYKVFAFKAAYSGWSDKVTFNATTASNEIIVRLDLPLGKIIVNVKDNDGIPLQFSEVQLFDEYKADTVSGKKLIENADGSIEFAVKADKKVYAVIKKEGYESYTTLPKQVIGDGTIIFNAQLSKPPVDKLVVRYLGLYKGETSVMSVEAGKEYDALFEVTAPKTYDELGFFVRVGKDNVTKTELDKIFIKNIDASGKKLVKTGATYNKPNGYSIDSTYENLEESKWAEIQWLDSGYVPGKILVGIKVKIRQTAQAEERLDIGYRAWGVLDGEYERDLLDSELGTSQNVTGVKQELYASTKEAYATVGTETLCEKVNDERSFCITASFTDPENFTQSFTDGFEAKNNSAYNVSIKVMNNSLISFDRAKVMLENPEENLFLGNYSLITPIHAAVNGTVNGYKTEWIDTPQFEKGSAIDFVTLNLTPQKTGSGILNLRLREENSLVFEKAFTISVGSDKKMNVQYMKGGEFGSDMPQIVSGRADMLTVKAFNTSNNLEIENALVKLYDRFGTKLLETPTNKLGTATLQIPASLPGEKLTLRIEKEEYETFVKEFEISKDVIKVTPEALSFTVNPQSKPQDTKTVRIDNDTGMDLTIKSITLSGKLKGLLNEAQIESWFDSFIGKKIASQDFEEIDFKVISATIIPQADDLDGTFTIVVGAGTKSWAKDITAKIRVGLGKDVDNASCLEITQNNWVGTTQGAQIETSLEVKNNCIVDGKPVALTNLGATITTGESMFGSLNAQSKTVQVELGTGYARIFKTIVNPGEKVPVTIKFTPYGGASGVATGSIVFEALNKTDSKPQKLTAEMKYNLSVENLQECIVIGADLIKIPAEGTQSFSIQNTCKTSADFQIEAGELQISNKIFTLAAGASKDVVVTRNKGDIPGAYNILIRGRKQGTTFELLGNVKAILDSEGCFALSRYEYDVYDSPYNENDGLDRGYLMNTCVQKQTMAKVSGTIPYDMSDLWKFALAGALGGYIRSGDLVPDWMSEIWNKRCSQAGSNIPLIGGLTGSLTSNDTCKNLSMANDEIKSTLKQKLGVDCSYAKATIVFDQEALKSKSALVLLGYNQIISDVNKKLTEAKGLAPAVSGTKECADAITCLKDTNALAEKNKADFNTAFNKLLKEQIDLLNKQMADNKAKCDEMQADIEKQFTEFNTKITAGQTLEVGKKALDTYKSEREAAINTFNTEVTATSNKLIQDANAAIVEMIEKEITGKLNSTREMLKGCIKDYDKTCVVKTEVVVVDKESEDSVNCMSGNKSADETYFYASSKEYKSCNQYFDLTDEQIKAAGGVLTNVAVEKNITTGLCCKLVFSKVKEVEPANAVAGKALTAAPAVPDAAAPATAAIDDKYSNFSNMPLRLTPSEMKTFIQSLRKTADPSAVNTNYYFKVTMYQKETPTGAGWFPYNDSMEKDLGKEGYDIGLTKYTVGTAGNNDTKDSFTYSTANGNYIRFLTQPVPLEAQFLLAVNPNTNNMGGGGIFGSLNSGLGGMLVSGFAGSFGGSALGGALIGMLTQWLQAENKTVDYTSSFTVPLVTINSTTLTSPDGIIVDVGEKTYDYGSYSGTMQTAPTNTTTNTSTTGTNTTGTNTTGNTTNNTQGNYMGGLLYNPQAMSATIGQIEEYELTFSNPAKAVNRSKYEPFIGILTVNGTENIYNTEYNYDYVKNNAKARGELKNKNSGFLGGLLSPPKADEESTAEIKETDLNIKETRVYTKKFHLLFDSWEYVDCGPKTYTCPAVALSNCDVDGKKGMTGTKAVPKIKLTWDYSKIGSQECDIKDTAPEDYIYCDSTQFAIENIKKLVELREFFITSANSNGLANCPQAIDYVSTKTAQLSDTSLDVGITLTEAKQTATGAIISATVESNNNLEMPATVSFKVSVHGGAEINGVCAPQTKTLTVGQSMSGAVFTCNVDKNKVGEGTFDIDISLSPQLCAGCANYDTSNDTMQTALVLGASGAVACQKYATNKDYFEKVLAANGKLTTGNGKKMLEYISFKANLIRDGFSNDFKNDLDSYLMQIANVAPSYVDSGIRELFLSEKFTVDWPNKPAAYEAGKYDARIIITFKNNSWEWDNNNIESIRLTLDPQGDPDPDYPIYDVPFDGPVGMGTDNGRQGYGANYIQRTEDIFLIAKDGANNIMAQPNASSNGIANVGVSVIKGNAAFTLLNTSPTKGNMLSISRTGDDVDFVITPSTAVPLILNITRGTSTDAFAFYSAEVNGQPQETGMSFISWTGIGEGCSQFDGTPMKALYNSNDAKANTFLVGYDGYGLYWRNAILAGTASFYGSFFAPQGSETLLKMTGSKDTAAFESNMGNGDLISVSGSGKIISNLQDVLDKVKAEEVCVIGGEYYWNNTGLREQLITNINSKNATCISAR